MRLSLMAALVLLAAGPVRADEPAAPVKYVLNDDGTVSQQLAEVKREGAETRRQVAELARQVELLRAELALRGPLAATAPGGAPRAAACPCGPGCPCAGLGSLPAVAPAAALPAAPVQFVQECSGGTCRLVPAGYVPPFAPQYTPPIAPAASYYAPAGYSGAGAGSACAGGSCDAAPSGAFGGGQPVLRINGGPGVVRSFFGR